MNKDKIIELFKTGGSFSVSENKFYHESFQKGFRKMFASNISLQAAERVLQAQLVTRKGITKLDRGSWIKGTEDDDEEYEYIPSAAELSW